VAQLSITRNGRLEGIFYLPDRPVVIGRADGVDIQLLDSRVSRRHSVVRQSVAGFMVQDLNTKNGTFVNKEAIEKSLLFHGDTIVIGGYTLHFLEEDGVEDLDSQAISTYDSRTGLDVPQNLVDGPSPRTATAADSGGPPPVRANRLDRKRPHAGSPPVPQRKASPTAAAPKAAAKPGAKVRPSLRKDPYKESNTQVPVIEGLDPEDASGSLPMFSAENDMVLEIEDSEPAPGKRSTTAGLPSNALGELVDHAHAMDTPRVEELTGGGLAFEVRKGTMTLGTTADQDVQVAEGGMVRGVLATMERDGHSVTIRPETLLRGVRVNGERISGPSSLRPGDVIELAGRRFVFGRNQLEAAAGLDALDDRLA